MSDIIGQGRFLRLIRDGKWEYAQRSAGRAVVAIICVTGDDQLVLVEQHRQPVGRRVIELPAGLVADGGDDESVEVAAQRELVEETGYRAERIERLAELPSSAGLTDEVVTLVRAIGVERVSDGGGVPGEAITVHRVPLHDIAGWLASRTASGALIDTRVYAGLWWLGRRVPGS